MDTPIANNYIYFWLSLKFEDNTSKTYRTSKLRKMSRLLREQNFKTAYLKVSYHPDKSLNLINDGEYDTQADLIGAFEMFTEPELREWIGKGKWS